MLLHFKHTIGLIEKIIMNHKKSFETLDWNVVEFKEQKGKYR